MTHFASSLRERLCFSIDPEFYLGPEQISISAKCWSRNRSAILWPSSSGKERLSPSRFFLAGIGMPVELFLVGDLYLALDDVDRFGNGLLGIFGVRLPDKKLNIIADL